MTWSSQAIKRGGIYKKDISHRILTWRIKGTGTSIKKGGGEVRRSLTEDGATQEKGEGGERLLDQSGSKAGGAVRRGSWVICQS